MMTDTQARYVDIFSPIDDNDYAEAIDINKDDGVEDIQRQRQDYQIDFQEDIENVYIEEEVNEGEERVLREAND